MPVLAKAALIDGNTNKSCGKLVKNSSIQHHSERDTLMGILLDTLTCPSGRGPCVSGKNDFCLLPGAQKSTRHNRDFYRLGKVKRLQLTIRYAHPHSIWYSINPKISLNTAFKSSHQLTSVTTEDLLIHNGCNRQTVKTVCEGLPQFNVKSPLAYKNSLEY